MKTEKLYKHVKPSFVAASYSDTERVKNGNPIEIVHVVLRFSKFLDHENGRKCFLDEQCSIEGCLGSFLTQENLEFYQRLSKVAHSIHPLERFKTFTFEGERCIAEDKKGKLYTILDENEKPIAPSMPLDSRVHPGRLVKKHLQKKARLEIFYAYSAPSVADVIVQMPDCYFQNLYGFEVLWWTKRSSRAGNAGIQLYSHSKKHSSPLQKGKESSNKR